MDHRVPMYPNFPAEHRSSASENMVCGDEELDEETANFISALYAALGPLLPEVTKLQGHQDPPAHLMVDMKAKLRELGSSVSDARKKLLRYNIYLKKKLAKAVQERRVLREQHMTAQSGPEQPCPAHLPRGLRMDMDPGKLPMGMEKNIQEISAPDFGKMKPLDRIHRRSDSMDERPRSPMTPLGILQKTACMPPHPPL